VENEAVKVRRIREDEGERLRAIRLELLTDVPWRAKDLPAERRHAPDHWDVRARAAAIAPNRACFVLETGARWIGIVETAITEDPAEAEIQGFWVSPAWRRKGLGVTLLGAAEEWARGVGFARLVSWVWQENLPAFAAHARAGFRATGAVVRWPERSDPQIEMVLDLE
jgi:GNAT superfamily N-acetyltransferase